MKNLASRTAQTCTKQLLSLQQDEGLAWCQCFETNVELMDGVNNGPDNLVALLLDEGLQMLVLQYDK